MGWRVIGQYFLELKIAKVLMDGLRVCAAHRSGIYHCFSERGDRRQRNGVPKLIRPSMASTHQRAKATFSLTTYWL